VRNIAAQTTGGSGNSYDAFNSAAAGVRIDGCWVLDSDDVGIALSNAENTAERCMVEQTDGIGIDITNLYCAALGNVLYDSVVGTGIHVSSAGDNARINGNEIKNGSATSILIDSGGNNCSVVGNEHDGALTDNATGTQTAGNVNY
jgi:hypothetical protein